MNSNTQIIDYKNFSQGYKQTETENTLKEKARMINAGMQEITESELNDILKTLGYKIDNSMCFNYYNTGNEIHYKARAMYFIDIKTKQSFAHYEQSYSNYENLEKLQKIRLNNFVFQNGRIWQL